MKKIILMGICITLGAASVTVRATDTPVQAAARAALMQRLNKVSFSSNEPTTDSNAPAGSVAAEPGQTVTNAPATISNPPARPPTASEVTTPVRPSTPVVPAVTTAPTTPNLPAASPAPVPPVPAPAAPVSVTSAPAKPAPAVHAIALKSGLDDGVVPGAASRRPAKINLSMAFILPAALVPLVVFAGATMWHRHQRRRPDKSPLTEPVESALVRARAIQADQMVERVENDIFAACGSCALAVVGAVMIGLWLPWPLSVFVSTIFLVGFASLGGFLMLRGMRRFRAAQNIRLAPVAQPQIVLRVEPTVAKERQDKSNGSPAATEQHPVDLRQEPPAAKEPSNGSNGKPAVAKEKTVKRRKTVSPRTKVRLPAQSRNGAA